MALLWKATYNVRHPMHLYHTVMTIMLVFVISGTQRINALQHTATHCNTLQHTATRCNTLQHTATHCNTLQLRHAAT